MLRQRTAEDQPRVARQFRFWHSRPRLARFPGEGYCQVHWPAKPFPRVGRNWQQDDRLRTKMIPQNRTASWSVLVRLGLVALQGTAAFFFLSDLVMEVLRDGLVAHTFLEALATSALVGGVALGSFEIRQLVLRARVANASLAEARAGFSSLVQDRFEAWGLTGAEREVALLVLKGFETAEIARLRNTATGTVRAQVSRIYEKSGKSSRGQFVASFIDVLIDTRITATQAETERRA